MRRIVALMVIGAILAFLPTPVPRATPDLYTDDTLTDAIQVIEFAGNQTRVTTPKMWLEGRRATFRASPLPEGAELHAFYESPQGWVETECVEGPTWVMLSITGGLSDAIVIEISLEE